jgi:hypothetical protein
VQSAGSTVLFLRHASAAREPANGSGSTVGTRWDLSGASRRP